MFKALCVFGHLSNRYLLSSYCVPDAVLDARDTVVNKIDKNPCSHGACVPVTINRSTDLK